MQHLTHNRFMRIIPILLSGLMLFAVACSKDEKVIEKEVEKIIIKEKEATTYVVGDPGQYLFGTKLTNFIFLPILQNQVFYRVNAATIKDTAPIRTDAQRVKDQTPSTEAVTAAELDFYTDDRVMGPLEEYKSESGKTYFKFGRKDQTEYYLLFEKYGLGARLAGYIYKDHIYTLQQDYINISISADATIISISFLDTMYRDGSKVLTRLSFSTKKAPPPVLTPAKGYHYLKGIDVLSRHDQTKPLVVNVCGKDLFDHKSLIDPMVKQWQDVLVGRLEIQVNYILEGCPPFTDINTHNMYMIDAVKTTYGTEGGMGARAYTFSGSELFDADIIFYRHELLKSTANFFAYQYEEYFKQLVLHEFGHFLGLDHQFDGVTQSVMAYQALMTLQPYDIAAIQALYPLITPKQ